MYSFAVNIRFLSYMHTHSSIELCVAHIFYRFVLNKTRGNQFHRVLFLLMASVATFVQNFSRCGLVSFPAIISHSEASVNLIFVADSRSYLLVLYLGHSSSRCTIVSSLSASQIHEGLSLHLKRFKYAENPPCPVST